MHSKTSTIRLYLIFLILFSSISFKASAQMDSCISLFAPNELQGLVFTYYIIHLNNKFSFRWKSDDGGKIVGNGTFTKNRKYVIFDFYPLVYKEDSIIIENTNNDSLSLEIKEYKDEYKRPYSYFKETLAVPDQDSINIDFKRSYYRTESLLIQKKQNEYFLMITLAELKFPLELKIPEQLKSKKITIFVDNRKEKQCRYEKEPKHIFKYDKKEKEWFAENIKDKRGYIFHYPKK